MKDLVRKNYAKLKDIFIALAVESQFPNISLLDYGNFVEKFKILEGTKLKTDSIDRIFIATNYEVVDMEENPDRSLNRFEFIEILIRLAGAKYRDSGKINTFNEALYLLLT